MVKDNALINASYHLELSEQRLILLAIVNARRNRQAITVSEPVTVTASEYAKEFGVSPQTANEVIKSASNNLFERQFGYKEWLEQEQDWKIVRSRWVSRIEQINNTGAIKLFFSHEVVRFTQELEKNFTSYHLEQVAELTSKYAIRLYEIILAWKSVGKTPEIPLQDLRDQLGLLDDEYLLMADFKKRIINFAINQINDKTDIKIDYEQHKTGRKITGFSFTIKPKDTPPKPLTKKQIASFAPKLARLDELSHLAKAGDDYDDFAKQIAKDLADTEKSVFYQPYLAKLGFK